MAERTKPEGTLVLLPRIELIKPKDAHALPPNPEAWISEPKLDGIRTAAYVQRDFIRILTTGSLDVKLNVPTVLAGLVHMARYHTAILDGELVYEYGDSTSDRLTIESLISMRPELAQRARAQSHVSYAVFDLMFLDGEDLTKTALIERKRRLEKLITPYMRKRFNISPVIYEESDHEKFMRVARDEFGLEGVVLKLKDSIYSQRTRKPWTKIKFRSKKKEKNYTKSAKR